MLIDTSQASALTGGRRAPQQSSVFGQIISDVGPRPLPYCEYPGTEDVAHHGLQALPEVLPLVDFARSQPYRSRQYLTRATSELPLPQVLQLAHLVARTFAQREPMTRHLQPPRDPVEGLPDALHADRFGIDTFGSWTVENILYWFIRLFVLTDPTSPQSAIRLNEEVLQQSVVIVGPGGELLAGSFNEPMPSVGEPQHLRPNDPFMTAVLSFIEPILTFLSLQDAEALGALCTQFPDFGEAYARGKVGHPFMIARSDALPTAETFEIVAATARNYQQLGYAYMGVEATNQWSGAACEALGGVRVHFAPFQTKQIVFRSPERLPGRVTSPNGYLSNKDSGSMFYVIRLT